MNQDIDEKTKQSLLWNTTLPAFSQIIKFAFSIIIARLLNPIDFGIMGIASVIIFYADSLSNFGFSTALIQREEISDEHIESVFTVNIVISVILAAMTCFLSGPFAVFFNVPELQMVFITLSSVFIVTAFYIIPVTLLRRNVSFKIVSQVEFIRGIMQSLIVLFLAYLGYKYWSLVIGLLFANIVATIIINLKVKWQPKIKINRAALTELFSFASWNFLAAQMRLLGDYADKLIIGKFLGTVSLGYYEKAFSTATMPVESVGNRIGGVMFSTFSRFQTDKQKNREYLDKTLVTTSALCFPLFIGFFVVAPYFVNILLGPKWEPMIAPFKILSIAFMFTSISNIIMALNIGTGKYKKQIKIRFYSVIVLVVLCLVAAQFDIIKAAYAILGYNMLLMFLSYHITRENIGVSWYLLINSLLPAIVSSAIMMIVVMVISLTSLRAYSLGNFLSLVGIGVIAYVICFLSLNFRKSRFLKEEITKKLNRLPGSMLVKKT